jgi:tetratricopeptide (TPR) repeat protein
MPTRRQLLVLAAVLPFAFAASAQEAPIETRRRMLFERLRNAMTEQEGRRAEDAVWRLWMEAAPSRAIARAVDEAMDARESYDFDRALAILDGVVTQAPDYAEGWNQRAFIRFLKDDLDGSLEDIDRALELEPKHFAALAGKALILMRQGRMDLGQAALRRAVEIHPWLKERSMLIPVPGEIAPGQGKGI